MDAYEAGTSEANGHFRNTISIAVNEVERLTEREAGA